MKPEPNIGATPTGEHERDAVHIAILPCELGEAAWPGQRVYISDGRAYITMQPGVGVVDPFRQESIIERGKRVWIFVTPSAELSRMQHTWTHSALDADHGSGHEDDEGDWCDYESC